MIRRNNFTDYDLGYDAGYRKALRELDEDLNLEEPEFVTIRFNNELFRNLLFNRLKKKQKLFSLDGYDKPEGFENAIPLSGQSAADEDEEVKYYYFVSNKDEMVYYITWLAVEDSTPVFKLQITGIKHLKGEVKTFKKLSKLVSYASNVEQIVDDVEYYEEDEFEEDED